jgi:hypothetical protein
MNKIEENRTFFFDYRIRLKFLNERCLHNTPIVPIGETPIFVSRQHLTSRINNSIAGMKITNKSASSRRHNGQLTTAGR